MIQLQTPGLPILAKKSGLTVFRSVRYKLYKLLSERICNWAGANAPSIRVRIRVEVKVGVQIEVWLEFELGFELKFEPHGKLEGELGGFPGMILRCCIISHYSLRNELGKVLWIKKSAWLNSNHCGLGKSESGKALIRTIEPSWALVDHEDLRGDCGSFGHEDN